MIVASAADHGGFPLKEHTIAAIVSGGSKMLDPGTFYATSADSSDYGVFVTELLAGARAQQGITTTSRT